MRRLKIGDRITIRILKVTKAEDYISSMPSRVNEVEKSDFKRAKALYVKLRKKY